MPVAITRQLSPAIARCEITHIDRQPIDLARAFEQHERYEQTLATFGYELIQLPAEPDLPDAVFVEDTAVVVDEVAVMTRIGAPSRWPEAIAVERVLAERRPLARIVEPGTLDGGDVLRVGRQVFVGLTGRTNEAGVAQLQAALGPHGYTVKAVSVAGCLHLKTAVSQVAPGVALANAAWVDVSAFAPLEVLAVDPEEPFAANTLMLDGVVVMAAAFVRTAKRLEDAGLRVVGLDMSELAKAEGALTCCSILL